MGGVGRWGARELDLKRHAPMGATMAASGAARDDTDCAHAGQARSCRSRDGTAVFAVRSLRRGGAVFPRLGVRHSEQADRREKTLTARSPVGLHRHMAPCLCARRGLGAPPWRSGGRSGIVPQGLSN